MTTYQMIEDETGAPRALVLSVKNEIIGNRHKATTAEITAIISRIKEVQSNGISDNNK